MRPLALGILLVTASATFAQIAPSEYARTYSSTTRARGYMFQAPADFIVLGVRVPDEQGEGMQTGALYRQKTKPPSYPSSTAATAAWYFKDQPSDKILVPSPPVLVKKGEWFGVLGAAYKKGQNTLRNSYGTGAPFSSQVRGMPVQLQRFITQTNVLSNSGNTTIALSTGSVGRVYVYVALHGRSDAYGMGSTSPNAPSLRQNDNTAPSIGTTSKIRMETTATSNQGGLVIVGFGKAAFPTAFGNLLVLPPFFPSPFSSGPIGTSGADFAFPIPNDNGLVGFRLSWQGALVVAPNIYLGNGLEQTLGQ